MAAPKNLLEFYRSLLKKADDFGFVDKDNGRLRQNILDRNDPNRIMSVNPASEQNFWFGITREDQDISGKYEGLSFVVFPESNCQTRCVISIGIGSSTTAESNVGGGSLGPDMELAMKLSFVRSFRSLTKADKSVAKFFFKLDFTEMSNPTPGLKEALEDAKCSFDPVMVNTVAVYDHKVKGGLLPAAALVDYSTDEGFDLIVSWLAQYAEWRNWSSFKKGTIKDNKAKAIAAAINKCKKEKDSLGPAEVFDILQEKRFIILQGAPGCGKTWTANEISKETFFNNKTKGESYTRFIQFHAETTYADFIYGIKPVLNGEDLAYSSEKGTLLKILDEALSHDKNNYLLIIDEINRANLANVLGPVFYLFEQTAENRTHKLYLGLDKDGNRIEYDHIPKNLYVVATMNTADKSLAVVDFALRRRFAWITLRPHKLDLSNDPKYVFDDELFETIDKIFDKYATDEELNLQPGQSYFKYPISKNKSFEEYQKDAIQYGLMPLIKEYISEGFLQAAKDTFAQLFYSFGVVMYE